MPCSTLFYTPFTRCRRVACQQQNRLPCPHLFLFGVCTCTCVCVCGLLFLRPSSCLNSYQVRAASSLPLSSEKENKAELFFSVGRHKRDNNTLQCTAAATPGLRGGAGGVRRLVEFYQHHYTFHKRTNATEHRQRRGGQRSTKRKQRRGRANPVATGCTCDRWTLCWGTLTEVAAVFFFLFLME